MIRVAVVTISDSAVEGAREDRSGPAVASRCETLGWTVSDRKVIADDQTRIARLLVELCDFATPANTTFAVIGSPAAAGFSQLCPGTRNCVPQAGTTNTVDGIGDRLMFRLAYRKFGDGHEAVVGNYSVSSGGVAGVRGNTLILNLPGSPKGAMQSLGAVSDLIVHVVDLLQGRTEHRDAAETDLN